MTLHSNIQHGTRASASSRRMSLWHVTKKWVHQKRITDAHQEQLHHSKNAEEYAVDYGRTSFYPRKPSSTDGQCINTEQLRLFVGTWNVGGKAPSSETWESLNDWLLGSLEQYDDQPADIYVIGFQEIVPLNPGNILLGAGSQDEDGLSVTDSWEALISATLNGSPFISNNNTGHSTVIISSDSDHIMRTRHSFSNGDNFTRRDVSLSLLSHDMFLNHPKRRHSMNIQLELADEQETYVASRYARIASKKMVGLFITVWVRNPLRRHVKAVQVSSVGCGFMGCLGNKGSVAVSLSIYNTSFCFICSHLQSGDKLSDAAQRNCNVNDILRRTRFHCSSKLRHNSHGLCNSPQTILAHDRILWFGDLNYRLSMHVGELNKLLANEDFESLLEKDQLRYERCKAGGVFEGWSEGGIGFAPTYKYEEGSNVYHASKEGAKRRAPAWCDRIIWHGKGLKQLSYTRCESMHSDHRPVRSIFLAEVEILEESTLARNLHKTTWSLNPLPIRNIEGIFCRDISLKKASHVI